MGLQGRPVDRERARRMADLLAHRGPDGAGLEQPMPQVALAHRRLAIIDLAGGHQPMCNEDGSVWLTFNGEIFNYRELREELQAKGHRFRSECDAEVLIHLYEEQGPDCVSRLNGQFAFALWDGVRLFCARDPLGIKPLYYYADARWFAFASEPRAFFAVPELDRGLDPDALALYFRYHHIPAPYSAYRNIRKLRPGEWLTVEQTGKLETRRYWDLRLHATGDDDDPDDAAQRLREALEAAVRRQLIADVPVGAFLSGGVDSSAVARLAQKTGSGPLRTFTIGFPGKDERPYAREAASWMGSEHADALFDAGQARHTIETVLDRTDEPAGDTSFLALYAVAQLARQHGKVALSGDGGDELFAGYERHARVVRYLHAPFFVRPFWGLVGRSMPARDPRHWPCVDSRRIPGWPERMQSELGPAGMAPYVGERVRERARAGTPDPIREEIERCRDLPPLAHVLAVDIQTNLADRLLAKVDRASMWTSLEVRLPLLDLEVVTLALRLAPRVLLNEGRPKAVLRDALRDELPPSVFERRKVGFGAPVKRWFSRELRDVVHERLDDSLAVREGLLDADGVRALLRPRRNGDARGATLWRVLALESWLRAVHEGRLA